MSSPPRKLTEEELTHFRTHGYVIAKDILKQEDFNDFEKDYTALIDVKAEELLKLGHIKSAHAEAPFDRRLALISAECTDEVLREHITPFGLSLDTMFALQKGFFDFQFNERLLTAIETLVGPEITLSPIQHARPFLPAVRGNSVNSGAAVVAPWHQDQGVTREEADASEIFTCWIPLTDVTGETGCLKVIPDCNHIGLLEHIKIKAGTTIKDLPDGEQIDCCMSKGDILIMSAFTPHCSQPNTTDKVRWSLDLRFQTTGTPTGRHFWPELIVKSEKEGLVVKDFEGWKARWQHDLAASEGERWHRVAGDVGGSINGQSLHYPAPAEAGR